MSAINVPVELDVDSSALASAFKGLKLPPINSASLDRISQQLTTIGSQAQGLGDAMTVGITAPLAAIGTLGTKAFLEVDRSLAQTQALTGLTGREIDALLPKFRDVGIVSTEGTNAAVSGFTDLQQGLGDVDESMAALDGASRLAALGVADMGTTSSAVVTALANYGDEGLTAARALDILTGASNVASGDTTALINQLGQLSPQAAKMNVSLDESAAVLALVGNAMGNNDRAGTALAAVFTAMQNPSQTLNGALEKIGFTAEELRQQVGDQGVAAGLRTMERAAKESDLTLETLLGSSEAASGAAVILGTSQETLAAALDETGRSQGALSELYNQFAQSDAARYDQAVGTIKVAMEVLGQTILPIVADALSFVAVKVSELSEWWQTLDAGTQRTILAFGAVAVAVGPVLSILGRVATAVGGLLARIAPLIGAGGFGGLISAATRFLGPIGLVIGTLISAWNNSDRLREVIGGLIERFQAVADKVNTALQPVFEALGPEISSLGDLFDSLAGVVGDVLAFAIDTAVSAFEFLAPIIATLISDILPPIIEFISELAATFENELSPGVEEAGGVLEDLAPVLEFIGASVEVLGAVIETVFAAVGQIIGDTVRVITRLLKGDLIGAWQVVQDGARRLGDRIADIWSNLSADTRRFWSNIATSIGEATQRFVRGAIQGAGQLLSGFVSRISQLWNSVRSLFASGVARVIAFVATMPGRIGGLIATLAASMRGRVSSMWSTVSNAFSNGVNRAVSFVRQLPGRAGAAIGSLAGVLRGRASAAWSALRSAFSSGISNAVAIARGLPGRVAAVLGGLGGRLVASGRSLIQGFANGIRQGIGSAIGAARDALGAVRRLFPFSPAKEGPFSGRGWTLFSGETIMEALGQGIRNAGPIAIRDTADVMGGVAGRINRTPSEVRPIQQAQVAGTQITFNDFGPQSFAGKRREIEWAERYSSNLGAGVSVGLGMSGAVI